MKRVSEFTQKEVDEIIELYNNGMGSTSIGKKFNVCYGTIVKILKKFEIPIKGVGKYRKFQVNENYFENIDDQNKAYFLGFLWADGNMQKQGFRIRMSLQEKDKDILIKLNNLIHVNRPIYFIPKNNCNDQYYLTICNKKIHSDLKKIGIRPNKTVNSEFPSCIEDYLIRHFIRGVFDGDGSIICSKPFINIVATNSFCNSLKEIVFSKLKINSSVYIIKNSSKVNRWVINGRNNIVKFLNWIYADSELFLERKYKQYQSILNWQRKGKQKTFTPSELILRKKIQKQKHARKKISNNSFSL